MTIFIFWLNIRAMLEKITNIVYPPQCLSCRDLVQSQGALCISCWKNIEFIQDPQCVSCGYPFDFDADNESLCAHCIAKKPLYDRARAVFRYDENSRKIVTRFKYSDKIHACNTYAKWMVKSGEELLEGADFVVPVPLHRRRLMRRYYNQSALLANAIGKITGVKSLPEALIRTKNTKPQASMSYQQRQVNVRSVFTYNPKYSDIIADKVVVLIDDVMTTGATVKYCTKALLKAGAVKVDVLTMARTVKE